jgi:nitrate reductase NapAB chaperone NapD
MVFGTRQPMNELKLVVLGLVVLVFSVVLLRIFEAPEIIEDKEVEIASALGIGLLILVLDKRSERDLHEKIHRQHDIINKMNKLIHEQHEFIMDLGNERKEKTEEK